MQPIFILDCTFFKENMKSACSLHVLLTKTIEQFLLHMSWLTRMSENLWSQYKNVYARKKFWKAARTYRLFDFEQILKHIEDNNRNIHV